MLDFFNSNETIHFIITIGSMALFAIGLYGVFTQKNLVKVLISFDIMESALFIFFIGLHYDFGKVAPIVDGNLKTFTNMVDPVPQAMILTTIVIGLAILALGLSFGIQYFRLTGINDISKMNELRD
ncbi:sodium:proton antiporter [Sulfurospirillum sp. 1612]|uniref:sodium:proton antiporter n=1 Tax=Sulfurospirillum sp. 1612 TaxID=3094835 RepID=UPI002F95CD2C